MKLPPVPALTAILVLNAAVLPAAAQAPPAPAKPQAPLFTRVIAQPTGQNGYEEFVLAAEALKSSRLWQQVEMGLSADPVPATLELKRRMLQEQPVLRAISLIRRGLQKPVFSPRTRLSFDTLLPELQEFRSLGRLLAVREYVYLADGRVGDAIDTAALAMRFGRVIQTDTLISGLVGVAVSSIGVRSLAPYLDQLSARDCERLYRVCLEWLRQPEMTRAIYQAELSACKQGVTDMMQRVREKGSVAPLKDVLGIEDKELATASAYVQPLLEDPAKLDQVLAKVHEQMDRHFAKLFAELDKPAWQRRPVEVEAPRGLPDYVVSMLMPTFTPATNRYTSEQAYVRLLAVHCAIRRYRWEYERLPESLAELRLGELALDPFTGEPLQYSVQGSTYRLASAGPEATDSSNPRVVDGRLPVSIEPE